MKNSGKESAILIADDDERLMAQEVLEEKQVGERTELVIDGEDLMDYPPRSGRIRRRQQRTAPQKSCSI